MGKKLTEWLWNGTFNLAWFVLSRLGCKRLEAWEDGDVWAEERLRSACQLAKTLLDALRLDSGIGHVLRDHERVAWEQADAALTEALAEAEGR